MADETVGMGEVPVADGERVGFCQDCGKPLSAATIKTVGSGVFCEPCLERRLAGGTTAAYGYPPGNSPQAAGYPAGQGAGQGSWQSTSTGYPPPPPVPPPPPISLNTPSPALAGFLGLIPGVGAMYNGQFAKGVVHLVVFAVLVSLSDNVNGIFGLFVAGWVFFMAFEAYHTARARRDGLPLPDPFGWNNIGERMGFGKGWGFVPTAGTPVPPAPSAAANPYAGPATSSPGTDWVGYVPPTNFATAPQPVAPTDIPVPPPPPVGGSYAATGYASDAASAQAQTAYGAGYAQAPYPYPQPATYAPTFTGVDPAAMPVVPGRRFPVGAFWLIGLGVLFLIGNVIPTLQFSWRWMIPLALALFAAWLFSSRLGSIRSSNGSLQRPSLSSVVCGMRVPVMFLTLAILLALQAGYILTMGQTWPVLFIVFGAMLVLERTVGRSAARGAMAPGAAVPGAVPPAGWTPTAEPVQPVQPFQGGQ